MMDLLERLRCGVLSTFVQHEAADEIERLQSLLQNGSPVVEGTIQHMAMRISELEACIKSHGIPVKTMTGDVAHYCTKEEV